MADWLRQKTMPSQVKLVTKEVSMGSLPVRMIVSEVLLLKTDIVNFSKKVHGNPWSSFFLIKDCFSEFKDDEMFYNYRTLPARTIVI